MNMIELFQFKEDEEREPKPVIINKEAIVAIEPYEEGTMVTISTGRAYLVIESPKEILQAPAL